MTAPPSEALVGLAVQFGGGDGRDLATDLVCRHPGARMQRTTFDAVAATADDRAAPTDIYAAALADPLVTRHVGAPARSPP